MSDEHKGKSPIRDVKKPPVVPPTSKAEDSDPDPGPPQGPQNPPIPPGGN